MYFAKELEIFDKMVVEKAFLERVESFINEHSLLDKDRPVIVGLSGGADSMALLDSLNQLGYNCIAAHCNFHLRGDESMRDHEFARMQAINYNVPFYEVNFSSKEYAAENHQSIEMACRELRYDWFEKILQQTDAQAIAVAHHKDDSIETLFLNLFRGTGINGMIGISPVNGHVVRPMLGVNRQEIEDYLACRHIDFITDSTNKEDIYKRNKIRLQLMPIIKTINPSASDAIIRSMENLRQAALLYNQTILEEKEKVVSEADGKIYVNIEELKKQISPKALLFEILKDYSVPGALIDDIWNTLDGISGKQFFCGDYRILKDRNCIIVAKSNFIQSDLSYSFDENVSYVDRPMGLSFSIINHTDDFTVPKNSKVGCFDAEKICWPIELRKWKTGDVFMPLGMRGSKKISDYFSDHKFSVIQKEEAWLMTSGEEIMWLVGERIDNRFKISSKTKKILMISLL